MLRKKIKIIFCVFLVAGILPAFWGLVVEPNRLPVKNYNLKVRNWSPKLNGFKIVAVADIHASNFIDEAKIRRIVELANAQNADIIVLLGDYVLQQHFNRRKLKMPIETVAENLKGLKAAGGVYAVMGNRDGKFDVAETRSALEGDGYRVLENEAVSIEKNGEKLRIVGLPDSLSTNAPANGISNAEEGLKRLGDDEGNVLLLTHNPDDIVPFTDNRITVPRLVLALAAHTHGGQIRLPFVGAPFVPSQFGRKYAAGFVREKAFDVFVTTGIGTSILPVRINVPPEISVLNIEAE